MAATGELEDQCFPLSPTPVFGFIFPLLSYEQHLGDMQCSFFKSRPEKVNEMDETCHLHMLKWKEQLKPGFCVGLYLQVCHLTRNLDSVLG